MGEGVSRYLKLLKAATTRVLFLGDKPSSYAEALEKLLQSRSGGLEWPDEAETLVGLDRLNHREHCSRNAKKLHPWRPPPDFAAT